MMTFSSNQKRAARAILAADGWIIPARNSALVSIVAHCKALPAVDAMAAQLDALDAAQAALETLGKRGGDVAETLQDVSLKRQSVLNNPPPIDFSQSVLNNPPPIDFSQTIYRFAKL